MCILLCRTFPEGLLNLFFEYHSSSIQKKFSCQFRALGMLLWMGTITIKIISIPVHVIIFILFLGLFSMLKETSNTFTLCHSHKAITNH
uniref:Uncharacterized protein n=1 Tax=Zea mays TaxID=4577 RepID=C4J138_MAIZE|nr:unknown [Zea mays]